MPGARVIGTVGGDALELAGAPPIPVAELRAAYEGAIPALLERRLLKRAATTGAAGTLTFGPGVLPFGDRRPSSLT